MFIKLTNEIVDQKLQNRSIKRLNNITGISFKIKWQCLKCDYIWSVKPIEILGSHKRGCPNCANNAKLTNEIIDQKLQGKLIKRLDNVSKANIKITWQCLIKNCNYIWRAVPSYLLKTGGCPNCSGKAKLTNEIIDKKIQDRFIKRIGSVVNNNIKIDWKCLDCCNIWQARPANILFGGGCPACKHKNEKLIYKILNEFNIKFFNHKDIRKINTNEKRKCFVDFYFPTHNFIIEYNGHQHYQPRNFGGISNNRAEQNFINQQTRDSYIRNFCQINNIELLEIDGRKYKNNLLQEYIIKLINERLEFTL